MPTGPQPTSFGWELTWNTTLVDSDPRGQEFTLLRDASDWQWSAAADYFPDQPAVTSCYAQQVGPNWAGFTQTNWYTVEATSTVG